MNTQYDHQQVDEARWQAQEKARRGDADADADELRIARALRRVPPVELPLDFAAQVAAIARAQVAAQAVTEPSVFEQRLLRGLIVVFAFSAAVVVAWFGRGWVAALADTLPGGADAVGWSAAAAVCLLANWGWGALRGRLEHGSPAAA
ncbi:MAG: hypothetical protein EOP93_01680 [Lysobacteraceae bacterium]|nr:MAG: hypothetical protein EOP93_01680 [Xanthomonadaceae bacterium]